MAAEERVDPRPRAAGPAAGGVAVRGWRCAACRYPTAQPMARCPLCRGALGEDLFGPEGEVFASTCLRVRVPGHRPPFAVAYLVLDDGPRILTHSRGDVPLPPGARARVAAVTEGGDLVAELLEADA